MERKTSCDATGCPCSSENADVHPPSALFILGALAVTLVIVIYTVGIFLCM